MTEQLTAHLALARLTLVYALTASELRRRYVGNVLGIAWAFIQPATSIAILWFVFQVGFKIGPVSDKPFVLWLTLGMLPWFFFADAVLGGTRSILENDFLVKKLVFPVGLLPLIKLNSALLIHGVLLVGLLIVVMVTSYAPSWYWLQVFYYMLGAYLLALGISWLTSAAAVFFRDIGEIAAMLVQFGFWLTPVFWSADSLPNGYRWVIDLNPMAYVIAGYRKAVIGNQWFWEEPVALFYFWSLVLLLLLVGSTVFDRLRRHFADVL
ncbi:ABC transporter permease [uncultured Thiodictyon sp.]|uniref:ABC transporter permease n=1 Tax=uncultured Thiodictyon sp. TaxID=1846217 RepID=UPI0025D66E78|nr:ABC transporter permease [uncultured Thiodictyon sp.]